MVVAVDPRGRAGVAFDARRQRGDPLHDACARVRDRVGLAGAVRPQRCAAARAIERVECACRGVQRVALPARQILRSRHPVLERAAGVAGRQRLVERARHGPEVPRFGRERQLSIRRLPRAEEVFRRGERARPAVGRAPHVLLHHAGDGHAVAILEPDRAEQHGHVDEEPLAREKARHFHVGMHARPQPAIELENRFLVQDDRAVALLGVRERERRAGRHHERRPRLARDDPASAAM